MRIASIDIGTNTVLLLIADVDNDGTIHPMNHQQRIPRLGRNVDKNNVIDRTAFDKIAVILNEYKTLATQSHVDRIVACATSAVRDASNRQELIGHLKATTSLDVEVITGEEEASLSFRGTANGFPQLSSRAVVLDIGGGSTEISFLSDDKIEYKSLSIGSVRLTERFFEHNPPTIEELVKAKTNIHSEFDKNNISALKDKSLIGIAGTVTTIACLEQHLDEFELQSISGFKLNQQKIDLWYNKLSVMSSNQIRSLSNTTEGRADILTAGVLILNEFMKRFHFQEITVSERGLRYGIILREWNKYKF